MPDENDAPKGGDDGATGAGFKPIESQDALDRIIGERVARERAKFADYADLKTKAEQFDAAQDAAKSDLQKALDRATAAETERDTLRTTALRTEVGAAKGLTVEQAARLVGATREELEADADALLAAFKPTGTPGTPPPGSRSTPPGRSTDTGKPLGAAEALRALRRGN